MPGILGIVHLPGDPPEARSEILRRMCARLQGPHDRLEVHETPAYAIAVARLDTDAGPDRILVDPDRIIACDCNESRVTGHEPVLSEVEGSRVTSHSSALAIWKTHDRALRLTSDRYGFAPVCYAVRQGRFLFASSALALLGAPGDPPRLDPHAASDLLCFGHLLEDRTLVEGIHRLPPATTLTWQNGHVTLSQDWTPDYREDDGGPSGPLAAQQMAERLEAAVRRDSKDGIGILLSGGLDSRAVAAVAARAHRVKALTFGEPDTDDIRLSGQVARRLGLEHHTFALDPDDLPHHAEAVIRRTDGALNLHHAYATGTFDAIRTQCPTILSGAQMLGSFLPARLRPGGSVLPFLIPPLPRETRQRVLTDDAFAQTERFIPESLATVDAACPFRHPVNRLDALDIAHRQRRFILAGLLPLRDRVAVRLPLFDADLMDFVRDTAPSLRANQRLYTAAFCRLFPDLARIPWAKTGLPVSAGPARLFLSRALRRLRPPRPSLARTGTWHARSAALRDFERDLLLGPDARQRGLFRPDAVERLLIEQEQGLADHWDLLGRIVTLELWCRIVA